MEAASHNQYRGRAELRRSIIVVNVTNPAKIVDCQR
jgi:hypothetical protein